MISWQGLRDADEFELSCLASYIQCKLPPLDACVRLWRSRLGSECRPPSAAFVPGVLC